jgi:hypothetical protein
MADEDATTTEDEAVESGDQGPARDKKTRRTDLVVMKELRRARRLFRDDQTAAQANFAIATANVLALIDLAAAIRETNPGADSEAD